MVRRLALALLAGAAACASSGRPSGDAAASRPYVVMVSFDAFRHDYIDRFKPAAFAEVASRGVRASSLIPSGFNLGIAIAAVIGAGLLDGGYGYRSLPVLGAVALALACLVAILSLMRERSTGVLPPQPAAA